MARTETVDRAAMKGEGRQQRARPPQQRLKHLQQPRLGFRRSARDCFAQANVKARVATTNIDARDEFAAAT